jgi:hypothetical protein
MAIDGLVNVHNDGQTQTRRGLRRPAVETGMAVRHLQHAALLLDRRFPVPEMTEIMSSEIEVVNRGSSINRAERRAGHGTPCDLWSSTAID